MGSDGVELGPVGIGLAREVERIVDLLAVEPLILQALEGPFTDPVLARGPDTSPNVPELRVCGDEVLEAERPERPCVVGDQRDRNDLASLRIGEVIDERDAIEHRFGLR